MTHTSLTELGNLGQSVWLDYIRRDLLESGELKRLIEEDGLRGMTSNPAIFEKAIVESHDYDKDIQKMASSGLGAAAIYEALSQHDVQCAADEFRSLYEKTQGIDGYVSLEVNPHLAHDTVATVNEAQRLWAALDRPNVFIKVPATDEGLRAITQLIGLGINVNITLLFGLPRYRQAAEAYIEGLEIRANQGKPLNRISSVASFFISRIDVFVDAMLEKIIAQDRTNALLAKLLLGEAAIASAKMAYLMYQEIFTSPRFGKLALQGARAQRLLWASTGVKNPEYLETKYVEELIGVGTVNTLPLETLNAYRDHGQPKVRIVRDVGKAAGIMDRLPKLGIDIDAVAQTLETQGIDKFNKPYDTLLAELAKRMNS